MAFSSRPLDACAGESGGNTAGAGQGAHQQAGVRGWPGVRPQHGPQIQGAQLEGPHPGACLQLAVTPHPHPNWGVRRSVLQPQPLLLFKRS